VVNSELRVIGFAPRQFKRSAAKLELSDGKGMDEKTKVSLLKDEYSILQQFYEDFDKRILSIKGWSATIAIAAIGGGFAQTRYLWLFAAAASLIFWLLESLWKGFQYMYAPRIAQLEKVFREEKFDEIFPLQIYTSWFETFKKRGFQIGVTFRMGIVSFPHVITLIAGTVLFLLETFNVITIVRK